jgi:hypothetical protein
MIENSKVMVKIEYFRAGIRTASLGEIDEYKFNELRMEYELGENKFNELRSEGENFICLTNGGQVAWIDKEAILGFCELEIKSTVYERNGLGASTFPAKKELRIGS